MKCPGCGNGVPSCSGGKCGFSCNAPYQNCDNSWGNGCEVDTSKDVNNCGACGTKCISPPNASASCSSGKCVYTCKPGYKNCDGQWSNGCEVDTTQNSNNCGACGTCCIAPPNASAKCYLGTCQYTCNPGWKNCDGKWQNGCETDTTKDTNNCGGCGVCCVAPPNALTTCSSGQCTYTCKPGCANCDNNWINGCESTPGSDVNNCGTCGSKCSKPKYFGGQAKCS